MIIKRFFLQPLFFWGPPKKKLSILLFQKSPTSQEVATNTPRRNIDFGIRWVEIMQLFRSPINQTARLIQEIRERRYQNQT